MENKQVIDIDIRTFIKFWGVILAIGLVGLFVWNAFTVVLILGLSAFFAISIYPIMKIVDRKLPGKRLTATILTFVFLVLVLGVVGALIVPTILNETITFVSNLPAIIEGTSLDFGWINAAGNNMGIEDLQATLLDQLKNFSADFVSSVGTTLVNGAGVLTSFITALVWVIVLTFLMVLEGPTLYGSFIKKLKKYKNAERFDRMCRAMSDVVTKYMHGQVVVALINGMASTVVVGLICLVFGLPLGLAFPLGLISGLISLIPMFGTFVGGAIVAVLLAFNNWIAGLVFFVYFLVYMQIEGNVISPRIMSKGLKMSALAVLVSVMIGIYTFGLIGALLSIPIAGCIKVVVNEFIK